MSAKKTELFEIVDAVRMFEIGVVLPEFPVGPVTPAWPAPPAAPRPVLLWLEPAAPAGLPDEPPESEP